MAENTLDPERKITKFCSGCGGGCPGIDETTPDMNLITDDYNGVARLNDVECRQLGIHLMKRFNLTAADLA